MVYALILDAEFTGNDDQVTVVKLANDLATLRTKTNYNPAEKGGGEYRSRWLEPDRGTPIAR